MANLYDTDYFKNYNNQLPNTQNNSGLQWWMNADRSRYPSPMMPDNLTQDLGASTVQAPNTLDPNWQHQLRMQEINRGNINNRGFNFPNFGITGILSAIGDKFKRPEEKQRAYDAITGGRPLGSNQFTRGMYGGNEFELYNSPSGLKVGSDILGYGEGYEKNFDSMFGSKSLEEMEQKKIDWALERVRNKKAISQRLRTALTNRGLLDGDSRIDTDTTGPVQTDRQKIEAYTGRPMSDYRASRPASERQFTGYGRSGMGRDPDDRMAYGGRAGYREGLLVDEDVNIEGPGFDINENVMMASDDNNTRILENLFEKYLELGFSPQDAEIKAMEEFELMSQGPEQDQGLASLV